MNLRPERLWPIAIVGVLAATVGANVVIYFAAAGPQAAAIEPDYYRKALAWDSTLAQRERDAELGWRLDARLGDVARDGATIVVTLADSAGGPIDEARIEVVAVHNSGEAETQPIRLAGAGGGSYAAALPLRRAGLWELRFDVAARGERFTSTVRREASWTR